MTGGPPGALKISLSSVSSQSRASEDLPSCTSDGNVQVHRSQSNTQNCQYSPVTLPGTIAFKGLNIMGEQEDNQVPQHFSYHMRLSSDQAKAATQLFR